MIPVFLRAALFVLVALPGLPAAAQECAPLLRHTVTTLLDEKPQDLCQYRGKVLLVVNTASFCGYTAQYEGLERLYARLKDRGLVVLGFPSNDFGQQEPGSAQEIKDLCEGTYGVRFPMFSKLAVTGPQAHPFYRALAAASGRAPQWNFHKYLVDRGGKIVRSYESRIGPDDARLVAEINTLLAAR